MTASTATTSDRETLLQRAREIADDVLFANALEADLADRVPETQLQCLADEGYYGISIACDAATIAELIEIFAGGCLTTAFVWAQHLGAAAAAWHADGPVRAELAERLASGELRGGVAFAHMLRPGPPGTTVERDEAGWRITGSAPWVTGWGHIDVVHVAARHGDDIVWGLIDAIETSTQRSELLELATVDASQTVVLHFDDHPIPDSRVTSVENFETWRARYALGLRNNGSLPLGVASRCCRLLGPSGLDAKLVAARDALNAATPAEMAAARADAALLAVQAATALVASTGGRAVTMNNHGQRLVREAMFLMVQGQTPAIRSEMLGHLGV